MTNQILISNDVNNEDIKKFIQDISNKSGEEIYFLFNSVKIWGDLVNDDDFIFFGNKENGVGEFYGIKVYESNKLPTEQKDVCGLLVNN